MKKLFHEPLTHFVLLGVALFVAFGLIGKVTSTEKIIITSDDVQKLIKGFQYDNKRPPTPKEVDRIIDDYVREEILCREAVARGLVREIPAVRRELRLKMEFNSDSAEPVPTDQQLQAFLDNHKEQFGGAGGSTPALADVRVSVQTAWVAEAQREARDAAYQKLRNGYTVIVQRPPADDQSAPASAPAVKTAEAR